MRCPAVAPNRCYELITVLFIWYFNLWWKGYTAVSNLLVYKSKVRAIERGRNFNLRGFQSNLNFKVLTKMFLLVKN